MTLIGDMPVSEWYRAERKEADIRSTGGIRNPLCGDRLCEGSGKPRQQVRMPTASNSAVFL